MKFDIQSVLLLIAPSSCFGFSTRPSFLTKSEFRTSTSRLRQFAPPGSGYASAEDEPDNLPATYEPMMEYPGTMRPGRTPENQPFHDLPIADTDPDPVPWPHFQQIEWHHRWDPPNPHAIPMEKFIEQNGRWASAEDEAAMRAGVRRDVRQRRELEEQDRKSTVIVDDDEDEVVDTDLPVELGEGMFGALGSGDEEALTEAAVTEDRPESPVEPAAEEASDEFDDFLLDLGLDTEGADDLLIEDDDSSSTPEPEDSTASLLDAMTSLIGKDGDDSTEEATEDEGDDVLADLGLDLGLMDDPDEGTVDITMDTDDAEEIDEAGAVAGLSDDEDLDLGMDDEDDDLTTEDGGMTMVPLEDFGDDSLLDDEDAFDDGGFDYDGGGDGGGDGGDDW